MPYPLASLGVYRAPLRFDHLSGEVRGYPSSIRPVRPGRHSGEDRGNPAGADPKLVLSEAEYGARITKILEYLRAGDCYQINFTDAVEIAEEIDLLELYLRLRRAQPTSYGAYLSFPSVGAASFSPELHFRVRGDELLTRPMKGTARRGRFLEEDLLRRAQLAADEKNRAENVMIVDLLRNDMGRLCRFGSIEVPELFTVQSFGRVLQMTSAVRGRLAGRPRLAQIFPALFPSGSVTGAPKRRAMEIIAELERSPRGIYTGAIGYASPSGDMAFSVAIRTVVAEKGPSEASSGHAVEHACASATPGYGSGRAPAPSHGHSHRPRLALGVGSGIVIDSSPADEYRECMLKASFLAERGEPFELIETMRLEQGQVHLLESHLARLEASAVYFGYPFGRLPALDLIADRASEAAAGVFRLRLLLRHDGELRLDCEPLAPSGDDLTVGLWPEPVDSSDPFLFHKTSRRERQERALALARERDWAEVLFVNERGELTEGAISNLFVELDGLLLTPPLECGLLPGVGRAEVLSSRKDAREGVLRPEDLGKAQALYLCSSLRGMRRVSRVS